MQSPRKSSSVAQRELLTRPARAAAIIGAALVATALTAATLAPGSEHLVDGVQLPTLPDSLAETGLSVADLITAPLIAGVVVLLAGAALIISATRRRSVD
ncbi:MAG: hypothetical protein ABWZ77_06975 [Naasia sp.]